MLIEKKPINHVMIQFWKKLKVGVQPTEKPLGIFQKAKNIFYQIYPQCDLSVSDIESKKRQSNQIKSYNKMWVANCKKINCFANEKEILVDLFSSFQLKGQYFTFTSAIIGFNGGFVQAWCLLLKYSW